MERILQYGFVRNQTHRLWYFVYDQGKQYMTTAIHYFALVKWRNVKDIDLSNLFMIQATVNLAIKDANI